MTNIIKQTLIEKREVIGEALQALTAQKNELIVKRAEELLKEVLVDFPEVSLGISYGDTIYFNVDKKEILSINSRSWAGNANHYLNTYSTTIDSEFEYKRLIFNGRIAEILYKGGMQLCINEIFVEDGLLKVYAEEEKQLHQENSTLRSEIARIDREEAEERKAKALENFYNGEEVVFEKMKIITYGRGKWDTVDRVVGIKMNSANTSKKKVDVEFKCQNWFDEATTLYVKNNIQMKYLEQYIK